MPDGERVTTGSEPRRTFTLTGKSSPNPDPAVTIRVEGPPLTSGEKVEVQEVVEPGHDEQTRETLQALREVAEQRAHTLTAPNGATITVESAEDRLSVIASGLDALLAERFKPSAPGGTAKVGGPA
jgi:hypothetical protein